MKLVGSRFRDRVNHTTCRTSVLGRIVRGVNLIFANSCLADNITDTRAAPFFGKERLVVIAAVNRAVVQQTRDAAKTYQTKSAVRNRSGGKNRQVRPATAVARKIIQRDLVNVG